MSDPIFLGPGVSEAGAGGTIFNELAVPLWYNGSAPVAKSLEVGTVPATFRSLAEEGGRATAAATLSTQARIIFEGVWDVVFIDSFDNVSIPIPDCALVLKVYEEDGETVAWEVGTSPSHAFPYLCLPDNYGAQELDIIAGAATIGQVEVTVIDKSQEAGDQDSGWLTERLTDGAVPAIRDRRCQLIRYINSTLAPVVIADGPGGVPRMDDTYSAYQWVIKDVRETERKIRAFTRTNSLIFPMGAQDGWGHWTDPTPAEQWLISPREPLIGTYTELLFAGETGYVLFPDYFPDPLDSGGRPSTDFVDTRDVEMAESLIPLLLSDVERIAEGTPSASGRVGYNTWPNLEILWRVEASGDPWTVVQPEGASFLGGAFWGQQLVVLLYSTATGLDKYELPDTTEIIASSKIRMRGSDRDSVWNVPGGYVGTLVPGDFPTEGQSVEVAVRYVGEPSEQMPLYLEYDDDGVTRLTSGRLLQKLYDGEYSDRDPVTGLVVPTGIRYNEADLLLMTDPVRARITEPIEDLRDWAEKHVYAPTGWAPSLDNNLDISPSSQEIPDSFDGLPIFDDDKVEPVPTWNAGETIVNLLNFTYERWSATDIPVGVAAEAIDYLEPREVTFSFRSAGSVTRKEEKEEFSGTMFAAIGDSGGVAVQTEVGEVLANARKLYVFDRYNTGAQTIEIPVKRSVSAELKPGDWIIIDLSWLPDYVTRRKGTSWGGQIVAIHDIDCAWRIILIEEAVPLIIS